MVRILVNNIGEIVDVMAEAGNNEFISDQYVIFKEISVGTGDTIKVVHETPPPPAPPPLPPSLPNILDVIRDKLKGKIGHQRRNILIDHRYQIMEETRKIMKLCYPIENYKSRDVREDGTAQLLAIKIGVSYDTALKFIQTYRSI